MAPQPAGELQARPLAESPALADSWLSSLETGIRLAAKRRQRRAGCRIGEVRGQVATLSSLQESILISSLLGVGWKADSFQTLRRRPCPLPTLPVDRFPMPPKNPGGAVAGPPEFHASGWQPPSPWPALRAPGMIAHPPAGTRPYDCCPRPFLVIGPESLHNFLDKYHSTAGREAGGGLWRG